MIQAQNRRFQLRATISLAPMTDGAVLIDSVSGECFQLNRLGTRIWECLARGDDLDRTVDEIAADHGVQPSVVAADTAKLIDELTRRGILIATP